MGMARVNGILHVGMHDIVRISRYVNQLETWEQRRVASNRVVAFNCQFFNLNLWYYTGHLRAGDDQNILSLVLGDVTRSAETPIF